MLGDGIWSSLKTIWYALRHCDEYEHIICENGHELPDYLGEHETCLACDGELQVRVERSLMLRLGWQSLRSSIFPYRLIEFNLETPKCEVTWWWRRWRLFSVQRKNRMYEIAQEVGFYDDDQSPSR